MSATDFESVLPPTAVCTTAMTTVSGSPSHTAKTAADSVIGLLGRVMRCNAMELSGLQYRVADYERLSWRLLTICTCLRRSDIPSVEYSYEVGALGGSVR